MLQYLHLMVRRIILIKENKSLSGTIRREEILKFLENSNKAVNATTLGQHFNVSRQIIVGDISLLRAVGHKIIVKNRGYLLNFINPSLKTYNLVVKHKPEQTRQELEILIKHNITILDVKINHPNYGLITGDLNISTINDLNKFIKANSNLISTLTDGIHVHTIAYKDEIDLKSALLELEANNLIYND